MRRVRRKEFTPWQNFKFDVTFMYQGVLLLFSACISCACFFLLMSFLLSLKDKIFVTQIEGGDIVTRIVSPLFWIAVCFAILLAFFIIFEKPISKLVKRAISDGEREEDTRVFNVKRRIRMSVIDAYLFAVIIFLMWLYTAVVFSLTIRNGTIEYLFIFLSLSILTFLAKKIACYPVYYLANAHIDAENERRRAEAILDDRDEGDIPLESCRKLINEKEYPHLLAVIRRAAKKFAFKIVDIEIILGNDLHVERESEGSRKVKLSVGAFLVGILTEEQLEAVITNELLKLKHGCKECLDKFLKFNSSLAFAFSSWNPIERIFYPITVLLYAESKECVEVVNRSVAESAEKYADKMGESYDIALCSASLKNALGVYLPFAYGKDFYRYLLKNDSPADDYKTSLVEKYFAYMKANKEKALSSFVAISNIGICFSSFSPERICKRIEDKNVDIESMGEGEFLSEKRRLLKEFDAFFVRLVQPHYVEKSDRLYKKKIERITRFEKELIGGKDKSLDEKISVAEDYLSLMMPEAAIDLLRGVKASDLDKNGRLNLVLGEAMLRLGDINGLSVLAKAALINYRYAYKAISTAERLLAANGYANEYSALSELFSESIKKYLKREPDISEICVMDDLTGEYRPGRGVSKSSSLTDSEKKALADNVAEICGEDRFEWAALVDVKDASGESSIPTLLVRCAEIPPGGYTDNYKDCLYLSHSDPLESEIRLLGDMYEKELSARLIYDARIEALEEIEGAVISKKALIEAEKILKRESEAFLDAGDEDEYTAFDGNDENDRISEEDDSGDSDSDTN